MTIQDTNPLAIEWYLIVQSVYPDMYHVIQDDSLCDIELPHAQHVFTREVYNSHVSGQYCPGQYVKCITCRDEGCDICRRIEMSDIEEIISNAVNLSGHHTYVVFNRPINGYHEHCSCGQAWR
jgi:hypothetical protein